MPSPSLIPLAPPLFLIAAAVPPVTMGDGTADADLSTKLNNLLKLVEDHASAIQQIKGQYSTLNVAVNRLQTKALDLQQQDASSSSRPPPASQPLAPITHKLRFPEYNGKEDPVPWLHKCEQFFRAYRTPETDKVSSTCPTLHSAGTSAWSAIAASQHGRISSTWSAVVSARPSAAIL